MRMQNVSAAFVAVTLAVCLTACQRFKQDARHGTVIQAGRMATARSAHTATLLPDGRVLLAGGMVSAAGDETNTETAEIFDPANSTFKATGSMNARRAGHTATLLPGGDVLIAGGFDQSKVLAGAEIYRAATGTFAKISDMRDPRMGHVATPLPGGRVLITGGARSIATTSHANSSAEIFDPATQSFNVTTGAMSFTRTMHTATLLADGRVLVAGGSARFRAEVLGSAELFDPADGSFSAAGTMTAARHKHAASLLAGGRVLVIGGSDNPVELGGRLTSAEVYDPSRRGFSPAGELSKARFKIPSAVAQLRDGKILVAGDGAYVEVYDPASSDFGTAKGSLDAAQMYSTATTLPDGRALIAGGYDEDMEVSAAAWLYKPS